MEESVTNSLPEEKYNVKRDFLHPTFAEEYELALKFGDAHFGSECKHERVSGGHCCHCCRKVVSK